MRKKFAAVTGLAALCCGTTIALAAPASASQCAGYEGHYDEIAGTGIYVLVIDHVEANPADCLD